MKTNRLLSLFAFVALSFATMAQAPEGFKYQAVVRDASNAILTNQSVGMQLIIHQGTTTGTAVYTETFATTSNAYGLVNLEIGTGTTTDNFSTIDWSNGPYFIETLADLTGGTTYATMGTSQLMSVPYALYAKTSGNGTAHWTATGSDIYNNNTGNVSIGYNPSPANYNLGIANTNGGTFAIGNTAYNVVESGRMAWDEDLTQTGVCGFEWVHDGSANTLSLWRGCTSMTEAVRYNRSGNLADFMGNVTITGDLNVTGNISKGGGTFKIDHPLDPENKYLIHSFVESPEMMNVYSGNITTDANGFATVEMPDYFEAANKDFRYQLTVIGTFAQAIIKEKISNNKFVIQTNDPNVEVSWQITSVRSDKYANAHRIEPVVEKEEKGTYLHPELFEATSEDTDVKEIGADGQN